MQQKWFVCPLWLRLQALLALGFISFVSLLFHFRATHDDTIGFVSVSPALRLAGAPPASRRNLPPPLMKRNSSRGPHGVTLNAGAGSRGSPQLLRNHTAVGERELVEDETQWPLFWVLTAPAFEFSRCQEIIWSWGQHLPAHSLLFVGAAQNRTGPSGHRFVSLPVAPDRKALKEFIGWRLVVMEHPFRDWFVKADDDTYFVVGNLNRYVEVLDPLLPYFLGCKFHLGGPGGIQYVSGGAGYILSRTAAQRLAWNLPRCLPTYGNITEGDLAVSQCLQTLGVVPEDTRDERGRQRFHAFPYDYHAGWYRYGLHVNKFWFHSWIWGPQIEGIGCCGADTTISFHYMTGHMRDFVWPPTTRPEPGSPQEATAVLSLSGTVPQGPAASMPTVDPLKILQPLQKEISEDPSDPSTFMATKLSRSAAALTVSRILCHRPWPQTYHQVRG